MHGCAPSSKGKSLALPKGNPLALQASGRSVAVLMCLWFTLSTLPRPQWRDSQMKRLRSQKRKVPMCFHTTLRWCNGLQTDPTPLCNGSRSQYCAFTHFTSAVYFNCVQFSGS